MKKIIGRGVLLLDTLIGPHKFGYELRSDGIFLSLLGADSTLNELNAVPLNPLASVTDKSHLILNGLPASPGDAFYHVNFNSTHFVKAPEKSDFDFFSEAFTFQVTESKPFAHGAQSHFSGLDFTFQYKKNDGLSIKPGGATTLHLEKGVFDKGGVLQLVPTWGKDSETLIFSNKTTQIQMDSIGKLSQIKVEIGSVYDRWANVKGLYTFNGESGEFEAHDISGIKAPSLYFDGNDKLTATKVKKYGATWTDKGISFEEGSRLASIDNISNPVLDSIRESGAFSVELWIKPAKLPQDGPARIFSIEGGGNKNYFFLGQGPLNNLSIKFQYPPDGTPGQGTVDNPEYREKHFKSPEDTLRNELMHVVCSCDEEGMLRVFVNGVQVAQSFDPEYYNNWLRNFRKEGLSKSFRIGVGNTKNENKPWKGEINQLAIFNRALTAKEVTVHYIPVIKITGDFSFDNVIPPLEGEVFPFKLSINNVSSSMTAFLEKDLEIKPSLGFRQIHLECIKSPESGWIFSGRFQTWFWGDLVSLNAHLKSSSKTKPALLQLTSAGSQSDPVIASVLGGAKFKDVLLCIGDQKAWELSFGEHRQFSVIPLVLENSYWEFKMARPHLVLTEPIKLEGNWLGEEMVFISEGKGIKRLLKGAAKFSLPFTLELPAQIDPQTGKAWRDPILAENVIMNISLDVELLKDGFLGVVNANFDYEGQTITLQERRIYVPPVSKMALLGEILEDLKKQADTIWKHKEDYYLDINDRDLPYIHLSSTGAKENTIKSILPRIFKTNTSLSDAKSVFKISQTNTACTLTMKGNVDDPVEIRSAFDDLMKKAAMNPDNPKGLDSGGLRLLQSRIAESFPLDYNQLMYFHYGWNFKENYIDLHPGMRLRVDFQNYQFVHVTEQKAKNGFVGGGSIHVPIHSYTLNDGNGSQYLGFGPFLSQLQSNNRGELTTNGAGGLFDLVKVGSRKKFFRLFFPNEASSAAAPDRAVTIVGSNSWKDLPTEIPLQVDNTGNLISFFFRDKAMIIPEIQVFVGNREVYVPVGTTLRQLIEKYANLPTPMKAQPNLQAFLGKARARRQIHAGADSTPAYRFLNVVSNDVRNNQDIFDLPLIKGDKFYF